MNCIDGTRSILQQLLKLLQTLEKEMYTQPLTLFNGSTLGQHVRHIFDFYHCFLNGMENGRIDYASRDRDPSIESDPQTAKAAFEQILDQIASINEMKPIVVAADFSVHQDHLRPLLYSSAGRELMFAHDHTVHHLAIIKMGIRSAFPYFQVDHQLGIAPSTLKYHLKNGSVND